MANYDIFLSYAHTDNTHRKRVQKALEERGLTVWADDRGIQPGVSWQEAIQKAIEGACCLVVILSPDAKSSRYVSRGISYADEQNKQIFPVLAGGTKKSSVPFGLTGIQYVTIAGISKREFEAIMDSLAASIRSYQDGNC